ncbi:MAG: hypothetical protein A2W93_11440 [Bacteroidetes bacterium GWF2_43_63]|nr:MAG: hypothetical protein A2W94_14315 [Bacteroidetes bacterium GWE2_42_42]OFY54884.1 MAG: hypothetical protein A2W93_11440 [Bacteroidetes bacterium GWF2_43_63]HCB63209.1 hypothetical protein [Bacteroidales bacterium]HCY22186.1 hypothetical protein [Bacteroidales bacterium]
MKRYYLIFLLAISVFSCKKDPDTITLSGRVLDPYQNIPVAGVKVTLQANGVVEGVYNSSFVTIATITTNAAGEFEFIIEESAYDSFRFLLLKDGYYSAQKTVSAGSISPEDPYDEVFDFPSEATLKMHIKNATPFDSNDKLIAYFTNNPISSFDCCSSTPVSYDGMTVDTTFYCKSVGGFDLMFFKSLTKNNAVTYDSDTLHTIPGDTLEVEVLY